MIPELSPDGYAETPDHADALSIWEMSDVFRAGEEPLNMASDWEMIGPHPIAGQINFCWENPVAWEILGEDGDRAWFMEQIVAHDMLGVRLQEEYDPDIEDLPWSQDEWDYEPEYSPLDVSAAPDVP